jgi:thiaminase (transcriptional activator TenA)
MNLSTRLWADNCDLAAEALSHPFVRRLSDGSLAPEIFAGYVAQDAFFLESFARAYALASLGEGGVHDQTKLGFRLR